MIWMKQAATAAAVTLVCALSGAPAYAQSQALSSAQLKAQGKERVIVAFKAGKAAALRAAIKAAGGREVVALDDINALAIEATPRAIEALRRNPNVEFIEADPVRRTLGQRAGKAPMVVNAGTQVVPYGIPMVQADQLSDAMASNRKVCIVDSGYERAHEDLTGNTVDGTNLTTSGEWYTDTVQHGTHVGGTVSAVNNSLGVVGVLPNKHISLYIAKVFGDEGSASTSTIVKGMLACVKARANVVSMSLGGDRATQIEQRVVSLMAKRDMLVIAAAGNGGSSAISYPAGFAEVMSVASIDSNKVVSPTSQFNADVEIAGPGVGVLSTVPMGTGIAASLKVGTSSYAPLPMEGSPVVSAAAALANFGTGEVINPAMAGKVCLIQRGNISFGDKALNCQNSGGVGAVIYNNVAGPLNGTLGEIVTTIPSVGVSDTEGAALLGQLGQTATVALSPSNYAVFDGTSMATPHVSAVAALVWSYFPHCKAAEIRTTLDNSAQDLGDPGRDIHFGYGLVQAKAAYDRINTLGCGK